MPGVELKTSTWAVTMSAKHRSGEPISKIAKHGKRLFDNFISQPFRRYVQALDTRQAKVLRNASPGRLLSLNCLPFLVVGFVLGLKECGSNNASLNEGVHSGAIAFRDLVLSNRIGCYLLMDTSHLFFCPLANILCHLVNSRTIALLRIPPHSHGDSNGYDPSQEDPADRACGVRLAIAWTGRRCLPWIMPGGWYRRPAARKLEHLLTVRASY